MKKFNKLKSHWLFFSCCRYYNLFWEHIWEIKEIWKFVFGILWKKLNSNLEDFLSELKVLQMTLPAKLISTIEIF